MAMEVEGADEEEFFDSKDCNSEQSETSSDMMEPISMYPVHACFKKLYPFVNQRVISIPYRWSKSDKSLMLSVSNGGRRVTFADNSANRLPKEAAAIRAECPIPVTCGIFYFEVTILSENPDGCCMGIGLCERNVDLNRLPGWDRSSYGYHGDDGNFFCSSGSGKSYGPTFSSNDVIGCGINFVNKSIFFTKNGAHLGYAISNIENIIDLYPMVGLQKHGEISDSNFGQRPFLFDFESRFKEAQKQAFDEICAVELPPTKTNCLDWAVSSWLMHEGYDKALAAFKKHVEPGYAPELAEKLRDAAEPVETIQKRKVIKDMILDGNVAEAIKQVESICPDLLEKNKELALMLYCQHYVEVYAAANNAKINSYAHVFNKNGGPLMIFAGRDGKINPYKRRGETDFEEQHTRRVRTHCSKSVNENPAPHESNAEDIDDPMGEKADNDRSSSSNGAAHASNGSASTSNGTSSESNGVKVSRPSATTIVNEEHGGSFGDIHQDFVGGAERSYTSQPEWTGGAAKDMMSQDVILRLLEIGKKMHCLGISCYDSNPLYKRAQDTLALICHTKVMNTPLKYLLDYSWRPLAAHTLNGEIREYFGYQKECVLNFHLRTARVLRRELADTRYAAAAFADADVLLTQDLTF